MKELPQYTLFDAIGWQTTRWIYLSDFAVSQILSIINDNYPEFIDYFTGLTSANSLGYLTSYPNDDNFIVLAQAVILPPDLYQYLSFMGWNNDVLLDDNLISMLISAVQMTPEFSHYLDDLSGITPDNSREYMLVINNLVNLPIFKFNAQKFLIT